MKVKEALRIVRKKYFVSVEEFATVLGSNSTGAMQKRIDRGSEIRHSEIIALVNKYGIAEEMFCDGYTDAPNYMPVEWYENTKLDLYRDPDIQRYYLPIDYMKKYKPNFGRDDFKIISMIGHKMDGGVLYMRDKDTLLIDTANKDLMVSGFFVYECEHGNYMAMSGIEKLTQGRYKFYYSNPRFEEEYRDEDFLKNADFRVVGRIIRNLSFFA